MASHLSIDEVARRTGLTAHTLRYYERIGLIAPVGRADGGQRRYAAADLAWIEFLLRLRTTRMPITKMQSFATLRASGDTTVPARRQMLEVHLQEVLADIAAMQLAAQALQDKIGHYQAMELDVLESTG
jgi:DNA-binding transcriptional MerR regulator